MNLLKITTALILAIASYTTGEFQSTDLPYYHLGNCSLELEKTTRYVGGSLEDGLSNMRLLPSAGFPLHSIEKKLIAFGCVNDRGEYLEGQGYNTGEYVQIIELRSIHRHPNGDWVLTIIKEK